MAHGNAKSASSGPPKSLQENQNNYRCNVCEEVFTSGISIERHVCPVLVSQKEAASKPSADSSSSSQTAAAAGGKSEKASSNGDLAKGTTSAAAASAPGTEASPTAADASSTAAPELRCLVCGKLFLRLYTLQRHELIHSNSRPFKCEVCGLHVRHQYRLTEHMRTHNKSLSFSCDFCSKTYTRRDHLNRHKLKTHQMNVTIPPGPNAIQAEPAEPPLVTKASAKTAWSRAAATSAAAKSSNAVSRSASKPVSNSKPSSGGGKQQRQQQPQQGANLAASGVPSAPAMQDLRLPHSITAAPAASGPVHLNLNLNYPQS
ncbi:fez family zinc finger protein erm-like [Sycon ciliatum]|uniref:fez family zinc finger protein erm-like n=1 Tax=Sycon ciliatum TaxID=27933 RepID=UPI0020AAFAE3|eukprot:scpid81240/ scgid12572/ POZ-, AT hook-, and zinc finger-containing protein 1; BTB/POZ domain zinc finger transcription factor; Protein kinase A RI subunit alpha-associated protein; Zinc finger and BTB domain-containing protein 19; Zinc finger protein 278; Zinc finger sarcoma gene protein